MEDIRDIIFQEIAGKEFRALLIPERDGCLSGTEEALRLTEEIGAKLNLFLHEGDDVKAGEPIGEVLATPKIMAMAEERVIGTLSKFSGIATASRKAVRLAQGKIRIVSGSWKKMPPEIKNGIRQAIVTGGASFRISSTPMVYLDKNYIRMLGSIPAALNSVSGCTDLAKVIQIKGKEHSIEEETAQAVENGCSILMVDTGNIEDVVRCTKKVEEMGMSGKLQIAFAGGVKLDNIPKFINYGIDMLCIGKEIVDAPLLDIKMDVEL
ncbi:beta/alpha barrel domain-containing protein [Caproiciproducens faecalis]|uniref:Quinolinate phosphoribosyl transferase n=1 Tax=Caproiciproducens faecalis TaxID=2820301 RepID=A0ABS7DLV1_9FIRM|nr:quinolinate phosphoribosyl transferase [Caproiciproducens faecalis]MBW7572272.1 quinolinate phosphoribosyl transferase [Caproiciproducens faecalis]